MFSRAVSAATTPFTRQHTQRRTHHSSRRVCEEETAQRRGLWGGGAETPPHSPTAAPALPPARPPGAKRPRDPGSPAVPAGRRRETGAAGARLTRRPGPAPAPRRCPGRPLRSRPGPALSGGSLPLPVSRPPAPRGQRLRGSGAPGRGTPESGRGASQGPDPSGLAPAPAARACQDVWASPYRRPAGPPDRQESREPAHGRSCAAPAPGCRPEPGLHHPCSPPSSSSSSAPRATLPCHRPPAPPPLAPPLHTLWLQSPRPSPLERAWAFAREEGWAEPEQKQSPNQRETLAPASLSPPFSFPPRQCAVSRPLGAAG